MVTVDSFFHPDYTVDPGITPGPARTLVGYTTDRELREILSHPAPKAYLSASSIHSL